MRFSLVDRIETLEPGVQISAVKNLSMAEEYLADHFPGFPVMPGVLMLEAMTEAGAWLVRVTDDFAHSMVVLAEVRNVKYGQFVQPGETLRILAELVEHGEEESKLRAQGLVGDQVTVRGQIVLRRYNLADENPRQAWIDEALIEELRSQLALLRTGSGTRQPMGTA
ncbi:MAG: 3-hydroxyacyl-ACP dehydratase FabZ family protein [Thermoguttaceae bacterium]|jgi:3-hydroxyacyl-[acyl-carrier-protein] dehydratase